MINVRSDDVCVVVGKRRGGKSYFFRHLLLPFKRRIIWDYNHEHGDMGFCLHYSNQLKEAWEKGLFHIVFQPYDRTKEAFNSFLEACQPFRNFVLGIEEAERYAIAKQELEKTVPALRQFIDVGRHNGVGIFVTARRINRLHQDIPANADHIFVFKTHKPQDLDLLSEWLSDKVYVLKEGSLKPFCFIHYDDRAGTTTLRPPV